MLGGWTEVDTAAPAPSARAVARSRAKLRYEHRPLDGPATTAYLAAADVALLNGGGLVTSFEMVGHDDVLHWYGSRRRYEEYGVFTHFLHAAELAAAVPELRAVTPVRDSRFTFCPEGSLTLDGHLAGVIASPMFYPDEWTGSAADAKRLAVGLVGEVIGERYEDFDVFRTNERWAPWFWGLMRLTWLLVDRRAGVLTLLCFRDTD